MSRTAIIMATLVLAGGFAASMAVNAASYERLGVIADGVHLVDSADSSKFRITADEPVAALVYDGAGDLVVAKDLAADESRSLVLGDGLAVVALFGGAATIESEDDEATISELELEERNVELISADGTAVDETITVELPDHLVGIQGHLEGQVSGLQVEAVTDAGTLFTMSEAEGFQLGADDIVWESLGSRTVDVAIKADSLDGVLSLDLATPVLEEADEKAEEVEEEVEEVPASVDLHHIDHTPYRFTVAQTDALSIDLEDGWALDASLYAMDGTLVQHIARGASYAEYSSACEDFASCISWGGDEITPETIDLDLAEGTYALYIRAAAVDGVFTFTDADGESKLDTLEELETVHIDMPLYQTSEEAVELDLNGPVLDIHTWETLGVGQEVTVLINDAEAYHSSSLASAFGGMAVAGEERIDTTLFETGLVSLTSSGISDGWITIETVSLDGQDVVAEDTDDAAEEPQEPEEPEEPEEPSEPEEPEGGDADGDLITVRINDRRIVDL